VEPTPLGTGGAVANVMGRLPKSFYVVNGDVYVRCAHLKAIAGRDDPTMLVHLSPHGNTNCVWGYVSWYEKGSTEGHFNDVGGFYPRLAFERRPAPFDMADVIGDMVKYGLRRHTLSHPTYEIGSTSGLARTRSHFEQLY
jgi:hypothetical protein